MDEPDFVEIRHPKMKDRPPSRATRASFEGTLKAKGWRIVKPSKTQEQNPAEGQPDEE